MLGLKLAREFFENTALPLFERHTPHLLPKLAIGLVGEGSECFGFDDEISQDHDFGPAFCLWLPENEIQIWERNIDAVINQLPVMYNNFPTRMSKDKRMDRLGLISIEAFYRKYTGLAKVPQTWQEWRAIPEHFLATATNGEIFHDPSLRFTEHRNALLSYYPEDIRLKKMAARLAIMAQSGQYNLIRSIKRRDNIASMFCIQKFCEAAISFVFLYNKKYMPFYKWAPTALKKLNVLSSETVNCLNFLTDISCSSMSNWNNWNNCIDLIENYAETVTNYLNNDAYSDLKDNWLLAQAGQVQSKINNPQLRYLPEMAE